METLLMVLGVAAPAALAWFFHRRAARLAARADYLEKAVKRRQVADDRRAVIAAEEAAAMQEVATKHAEATQTVVQETATVADAMRSRGKAAAASEHVKRLRSGAPLALAACIIHAGSVRAEPCKEGVTVMAGERLDCDAECLPEDDLDFLLKRSLRLMQAEADLAKEKETRAVEQRAATKRYDGCMADYLALEKSCAEAVSVTADTLSPSTYVLIVVGVFVVGVAAGAGLYHALRADTN